MSDTKHTPELLPCPFCGGQASDRGEVTYHGSHEAWWPDGSQIVHAYYCNCIRCGITSKGMIGQQTKELAREKWNQRAGMLDPSAEIAALRAELERKDARIRELEGKVADGILNAANCMSERDEWKAKAEKYRGAIGKILREFGTAPNFAKDIVSQVLARIYTAARAAIEEE